MFATGADGRGFGAFVDVTALAAFPEDLFLSFFVFLVFVNLYIIVLQCHHESILTFLLCVFKTKHYSDYIVLQYLFHVKFYSSVILVLSKTLLRVLTRQIRRTNKNIGTYVLRIISAPYSAIQRTMYHHSGLRLEGIVCARGLHPELYHIALPG